MTSGKSKRILIADDLPDMVTTLMVRLRHEGFDVIIARNGNECVTLAHQEKPDLIIMDVMMPVKNGYDACDEIKNDPATEHIPVFLITGLNQEENEVIGKHLGADEYFIKPFPANELIEKVKAKIGS